MVNIEAIIFYGFLLDSIGANIVAWCCPKWCKKNYPRVYKYVPITKAWGLLYLVLVLWIGWALYRLGVLFW